MAGRWGGMLFVSYSQKELNETLKAELGNKASLFLLINTSVCLRICQGPNAVQHPPMMAFSIAASSSLS